MEYRFTNSTQRGESGNWWQRQEIGVYLPPISLNAVRETG